MSERERENLTEVLVLSEQSNISSYDPKWALGRLRWRKKRQHRMFLGFPRHASLAKTPLHISSLGSGYCTNVIHFIILLFCICLTPPLVFASTEEESYLPPERWVPGSICIRQSCRHHPSGSSADPRAGNKHCVCVSQRLQGEQIYKRWTATFVLMERLNKLHLTTTLTFSCKNDPLRYFYLLYSWV